MNFFQHPGGRDIRSISFSLKLVTKTHERRVPLAPDLSDLKNGGQRLTRRDSLSHLNLPKALLRQPGLFGVGRAVFVPRGSSDLKNLFSEFVAV